MTIFCSCLTFRYMTCLTAFINWGSLLLSPLTFILCTCLDITNVHKSAFWQYLIIVCGVLQSFWRMSFGKLETAEEIVSSSEKGWMMPFCVPQIERKLRVAFLGEELSCQMQANSLCSSRGRNLHPWLAKQEVQEKEDPYSDAHWLRQGHGTQCGALNICFKCCDCSEGASRILHMWLVSEYGSWVSLNVERKVVKKQSRVYNLLKSKSFSQDVESQNFLSFKN